EGEGIEWTCGVGIRARRDDEQAGDPGRARSHGDGPPMSSAYKVRSRRGSRPRPSLPRVAAPAASAPGNRYRGDNLNIAPSYVTTYSSRSESSPNDVTLPRWPTFHSVCSVARPACQRNERSQPLQ